MRLVFIIIFAIYTEVFASDSVHNYVFFGRDRSRITEKGFLNTQKFEGAQLMYAWRELESAEDVYDFGAVKKDLNFLKSKGKKLFIQLQDTTFNPSQVAVPKYLQKNPKYNGGVVYQYDENGKPAGLVLMRWDSAVRGRFQKLLNALGKAFDGKIEGINLQETAIEVTEKGPNSPKDFTYSGYRDGVLANMKALRKAFPKSITLQYANFMPGEWLPENDQGYLRSIYEYGRKIGVGVGAPDLMPEKLAHKNHAYKFMHEINGSIPVGVAVQDGNYTGTTGENLKPTGPWPNNVPKLYDFAKNYLKAHYIFWAAQEPYFSHDVVPFFRVRK
jgi:hypothetical protein